MRIKISALKELEKKHREEIQHLRTTCPHDQSSMVLRRLDSSCVGCGSAYPSVHVVCSNCGCKRIVFGVDPKDYNKVSKSLMKQGYSCWDERITHCHYEHELEFPKPYELQEWEKKWKFKG